MRLTTSLGCTAAALPWCLFDHLLLASTPNLAKHVKRAPLGSPTLTEAQAIRDVHWLSLRMVPWSGIGARLDSQDPTRTLQAWHLSSWRRSCLDPP